MRKILAFVMAMTFMVGSFAVSAQAYMPINVDEMLLTSNETTIGHIVEGEMYYIKNADTGKYATVNNSMVLIQDEFTNSVSQIFTICYNEETDKYVISSIDKLKDFTQVGTNNNSTTSVLLSSSEYNNEVEISFDSSTGYYQIKGTYNGSTYTLSASSPSSAIRVSESSSVYKDWVFEPAIFDYEIYRIRSKSLSQYINLNVASSSAWRLEIGGDHTEQDQLFSIIHVEGNAFTINHIDYPMYKLNVTLEYNRLYGIYTIKNSSGNSLVFSFATMPTSNVIEISFNNYNSQYTLGDWCFDRYADTHDLDTATAISMDNINSLANKVGGDYNCYAIGETWYSNEAKCIGDFFVTSNYYTDSVYIKVRNSLSYLIINDDGDLELSLTPETLYTRRKTDNQYDIIDEAGNIVRVCLQNQGNFFMNSETGLPYYPYCYLGNTASTTLWLSLDGTTLTYGARNTSSALVFEFTENISLQSRILNTIASSDVITIASHGQPTYLYLQSISGSYYAYSINNSLLSSEIINSNLNLGSCKLLVLFSCNGGTDISEDSISVGQAFAKRGIETVVCFNISLSESSTNTWAIYFYQALGWGATVRAAVAYAYENCSSIQRSAIIDECAIIGNEYLALN